MSTYTQWKNKVNDDVKRLTWVCGPERVLVEEVVDGIRDNISPSFMDYMSMAAGETPDKDIWANANQYPMDPKAKRLILIRDADKMKNWKPLTVWLSNTRVLPNVYLLFVSNDTALLGKKDQQGNKKWLPPDVIRNQPGKVGLVECKIYNTDDLVAWVKGKSKVDDKTAKHLIDRAGGNVYLMHNVCMKASLFNGKLSDKIIDVLCAETPADDFVTLLLSLKKPQAMSVVEKISRKDYGYILGGVAYKLDVLAQFNAAVRKGTTMRDAAQLPGANDFLVKQLYGIAKYYDKGRQSRCRRVLALIDDAHNNGADDCVMELLCSLW